MAYPTVKKMLSRGPASDNRYSAIFTGVSVGDAPGWAADPNMVKILNEYSDLFISNMTMPGSSIATGEMFGDRAVGVSRKYAHTRMFNEFSMTYILEAGMELYSIYDYWMNQISPRFNDEGVPIDRRDIRMNYYNNYIDPKIILKKFERDGSESLTTEIYNAFPLNISDLGLSSRNQNGLLELTINFAYETAISYTGGYSSERSSGSTGAVTQATNAVTDTEKTDGTDKTNVTQLAVQSYNPNDNKIQAIKDREDLALWAITNEKMINKVGTDTQKKILSDAVGKYPQGSPQQKALKDKFNVR